MSPSIFINPYAYYGIYGHIDGEDEDGDDDGNNSEDDGDDNNDVAMTATLKNAKKGCENHAKRSEKSRKQTESV